MPRYLSQLALLSIFCACFIDTPPLRAETATSIVPAASSSSLVDLASHKFEALNKTERRVLEAVGKGRIAWGTADFANHNLATDTITTVESTGYTSAYNDPANDPAKAAEYNWRETRKVRGELLRWLEEDERAGKLIGPRGINVVGVWIDGNIDLSYLDAKAPIYLRRSNIPGVINLEFATIPTLDLVGSSVGTSQPGAVNEKAPVINGEGLKVRGDVVLSDGFQALGPVSFYGAKIDGQFYCKSATFTYPGDDAVVLRLAEVGGEAQFDSIESNGFLNLVGATIDGDLTLDSAVFNGALDNGLRAKGLSVKRALWWTHVTGSPKTLLDLSYASVGSLADDPESWPQPGSLLIDGFNYGALRDQSGHSNDAKSRLAWLERQPFPLKPQPYSQLVKVLRDNGEEAEATQVLIAKEATLRQQSVLPPIPPPPTLKTVSLALLRLVSRELLRLTIDYGYEPLRALAWIVGFVILGTGFFYWGYRKGVVIPTDHAAYEKFVGSNYTAPPDYQKFNSFVYSLETFIPLIELHQANYWLPNPQGDHQGINSGRYLRWYLWIHILLGWIFTTMLVAGIAGLVKGG